MATKGVELASAYISLSVSVDDVPEQVEKALKGSSKTAEKAGKDLGRKISDGAASGMAGGNMSKALARELGSAGDKGSKELLRSLASGHRQAEKDASTAGRRYATAMAAAMAGGSKDTARKFEAEFRNALNARNSSQAFFDEFHRDGVARGQKIGTAIGNVVGKSIGTALKVGVAGAAGAAALAVGGVGTVLYKGFQRLKNIDNAKFKLQALGNSASDVKQIMADAEKAVKGTAFSLDEAATGAASAVAAGIKPGEELTKYLTGVADTAAIAGTSFEEMAHIFNKVHTQNKAFTDDLQMLSDRGVPIFQWLQEQYHVTGDELSKMVQDGKVDAKAFETAVADHISGSAKKMGESFSGSIDNFNAALGRLGAAVLEPLFGNAAGGVGSLTDKLDDLTAWVKEHRPEVIDFFKSMGITAVSVAQDVVKSFGQIAQGAGDFTHALGTVIGIFDGEKGAKLQAAGDSLNAIGEKLITTAEGFDAAKDQINGWAESAKTAAENAQGATGPVTGLGTALGALPMKKVIQVNVEGDAESKIGGIGNALGKLTLKPWVISVEGTVSMPGVAASSFDGATLKDKSWSQQLFGIFGGSPGQPSGTVTGSAPGRSGWGAPITPGSGPAGSSPGQNPLDVFAPGGHPGPPQIGGGGNSLRAGSPREYAHQVMMPYWQQQGFQVGDHEADRYGEHQNGALDIMVPNLDAGQRILQQVLQDPNVYGAIFNGQSYGYGHGMVPQPSGGSNPHTDHVHVWYKPQGMASGGGVRGAGTATSDSIPAYLSNGEHVLTANDVAAMGGQGGVYAFRNALHRAPGGSITWMDFIKQASPRGSDPRGGPNGEPSLGPFAPWWDMDWIPPEHPEKVGPGAGKWWHRGPTIVPGGRGGGGRFGPPIGKNRKPLPGEPLPPWMITDKDRYKLWGFAEGGAVDPNLLLQMLAGGTEHGMGQGLPPGPVPEQMPQEQPLPNINTEGYIPAGAGYSGATTGGLYGGLLNMGAEAINGLIDKAAQVGGMAADAFAPGSSAGIQIGASIAKRGVSYGAQMLGIGAGAFAEILSPFGVSRWFSDIDPTAFIPQQRPSLGAGPSATGQMVNDPQHPGQQMPWNQQGMDASIDWFHREAGVPNDPAGTNPVEPAPPGGTPQSAQPAAQTQNPLQNPLDLIHMFGFKNGGAVYDRGGILKPNSFGINLSNRPEYVATQSQWKTMEANASGGYGGSRRGGPLVQIDKVEGMNPDDVAREIGTRTRRAARQYSVRP